MSSKKDTKSTSITGISNLLNKENVKDDVNLKEIEKKIIGADRKKSITPSDKYNKEVEHLASDLGIKWDNSNVAPVSKKSSSSKKMSSSSKKMSSSEDSSMTMFLDAARGGLREETRKHESHD